MKNKYPLYTLIIVLVVSLLFGFYLGGNIPIAKQWPQYERLQNISAIIITIIGIWIAVIYPQYLKILQTRTDGKNFINFKELIFPIKSSILILILIMLIGLVAPYLSSLNLTFSTKKILRSLSFSTLIFLTAMQVVTLLATFLPINSIYKYSVHEKHNNSLSKKLMEEYEDSQ